LFQAPYYENAPHLMALPYTEYLQLIGDLINSPEDVKLLIDFGEIKNVLVAHKTLLKCG